MSVSLRVDSADKVGEQLFPAISNEAIAQVPNISDEDWTRLQTSAPDHLQDYDLLVWCIQEWLANHEVRNTARVGRIHTRHVKVEPRVPPDSPCAPPGWRIFIGVKACNHLQELLDVDRNRERWRNRHYDRKVLLVRKLLRAPSKKLALLRVVPLLHQEDWGAALEIQNP